MPLKCRWRISSGTQASEKAKNKLIAVEVALEDLQRHSSGTPAAEEYVDKPGSHSQPIG